MEILAPSKVNLLPSSRVELNKLEHPQSKGQTFRIQCCLFKFCCRGFFLNLDFWLFKITLFSIFQPIIKFETFCKVLLTQNFPKKDSKSSPNFNIELQTSRTLVPSPRVELNELELPKGQTFRTRTQVHSITSSKYQEYRIYSFNLHLDSVDMQREVP